MTASKPHIKGKYPDNRCRECGLLWSAAEVHVDNPDLGIMCYPTPRWRKSQLDNMERTIDKCVAALKDIHMRVFISDFPQRQEILDSIRSIVGEA